jgi:hypothetical protein
MSLRAFTNLLLKIPFMERLLIHGILIELAEEVVVEMLQ